MKLWLLLPKANLENDPWDPWYDKAFGFVVNAKDEEEARKLANERGGDETGPVGHTVHRTGGDPWLDAKLSSCKELLPSDTPKVILRDIRLA